MVAQAQCQTAYPGQPWQAQFCAGGQRSCQHGASMEPAWELRTSVFWPGCTPCCSTYSPSGVPSFLHPPTLQLFVATSAAPAGDRFTKDTCQGDSGGPLFLKGANATADMLVSCNWELWAAALRRQHCTGASLR